MLILKNLNITFDTKLLENAFMCINDASIVSIDGTSGCGKTTLLKFIMNEVKNQTGIIEYNTQVIDDSNHEDFLFNHVTYVDQMGSFFPNMTVYEHFEFYSQLYNKCLNQKTVVEYLFKVGLTNIETKKSPIQLSTGERKRFLIAVALFIDKDIIILDEPTASLDSSNKKEILKLLKELSNIGTTIIITTHDSDVLNISHKIYKIENYALKETKNETVEARQIVEKIAKPQKVKYWKFRNLKLKILFMLILLVGSLCIAAISQSTSMTISLNQIQLSTIDVYQNDTLYFMKRADPRHLLNVTNNTEDSNFSTEIDFISSSELKKIEDLSGVRFVLPSLEIKKASQDEPFDIYKDNRIINKVYPKVEFEGNLVQTGIQIIGYYPEQIIKKEGKTIEGIYINEILSKMLEYESLKDIEIGFNTTFVTQLEKTKTGYNGIPSVVPHIKNQYIKITLSDAKILNELEYNDGKYQSMGKIYMPAKQIEKIIDDYSVGKDEKNYFVDGQLLAYEPRQYLILCEDGKDEQLKMEIEQMSDLYAANSSKLTDQEYVQFVKEQYQATFFISFMSSILLSFSLLILIIYECSQRKKEIMLLKRIGLNSKICQYYCQDNIFFVITTMIVSVTAMFLYKWFFVTGLMGTISSSFYYGIWIGMSLISICIFLGIKNVYIKKLKRGNFK